MMTDASLNDWLHELERRHACEIQLGLSRMQEAAQRLNVLPFQAKVITVAGTNGKGSTVSVLESIYHTAGYQVASYTSPHLIYFTERIKVHLEPISEQALCGIFAHIEQHCSELKLTYFETATLAAFLYFKSFQLDIILLEVGLGGRQDATNIVDADLAVITTIDLDHQSYLGHTKEAIGYEKAGILRPGMPFIYGDVGPPLSIIKEAQRLHAPLYELNKHYALHMSNHALQLTFSDKQTVSLPKPTVHPKAAAAAMMAVRLLNKHLPVSHDHFIQAMHTIQIQGRQQLIQGEVTILLDVAHNPQAVDALAEFIRTCLPGKKVHAVFSALKDKDLCGLIKPMAALVDDWYPALLATARAASKAAILQALKDNLIDALECFEHPLAAFHHARQQAAPGDLMVVYGSFLTVSAVHHVGESYQ